MSGCRLIVDSNWTFRVLEGTQKLTHFCHFLSLFAILSFSAVFLNLVCLCYIWSSTANVYNTVYKLTGLERMVRFDQKWSICVKTGNFGKFGCFGDSGYVN